jgi:hypothetical protein
VSLAPRSPPLEPDSPLQVPWHLASQPRRSLRDSSHLWLPFPLRQSLRDFCPERHRLLRHGPHAAPASSAAPTAILDNPSPSEWSASPIAYVGRPRQPTPTGTTPPPPLQPPPVGGQGMVVPVTPPKNAHQIVTLAKDGFQVLPKSTHPRCHDNISDTVPDPILRPHCPR